jgi:glycosyltransferase involved in cell wall biosynthesis
LRYFTDLFKRINIRFFSHQQLLKQQHLAYANEYAAYVESNNQSKQNSKDSFAPQNINAFITNASFTQNLTSADGWVAEPTVVTKPMHVMMLGLRGFPNVQGGIETHAEHLAPLLVKLGCNLEVLVRSPHQSISIGDRWNGVRFTRLWSPKGIGVEAVVHTFLGVLYAAIKRPDVLHIHAIGPALMTPLARFFGLKVVVTHHGPDYNRQKWGAFARNVLLLGEWFGMRFANSRIVISTVIGDMVMRKHTKNSALIHNGVVLPDLGVSTDYLQQFGLEKNKYIALVSRLVPEKRHLDLIEAFNIAQLSGYKLVFVGSIDQPDAYIESVMKAAALNNNIVLTGFQTGDTLRSLYAHAGLFVLPSSHEGLSISLLEALSYGLPVVASNIAANLEVGLNSTCYFELGNIEQLAQQLIKNTLSPASLETRMQLRNWIGSHYNWQRIAEKTYTEYRNMFQN